MQVLGGLHFGPAKHGLGDLPGVNAHAYQHLGYFPQGHGLQAADVELKIHHPFQRFIVPFVPCIANEGCTGVADEITDEQVERVAG
ncbi:MAG: hypothetical protein E6Q96_10205 [Cyclobacteriaceae bacterium]|nr:MAG: hypothetical protein E6Q96_10205 [Cyclobacteriaceae bacterium]